MVINCLTKEEIEYGIALLILLFGDFTGMQ